MESALLCALAACATPDLAWEIPEGVDRMEHFWRAFDESSEAVCNTNQYPELVSDLHTFADECPTDEQKLACIERAFAHLGIRRRLPCLLGHGTELPELLCDFYMMERRANSYVYGFAQMVYAAYLGKLQRAVPRPASRLISCA